MRTKLADIDRERLTVRSRREYDAIVEAVGGNLDKTVCDGRHPGTTVVILDSWPGKCGHCYLNKNYLNPDDTTAHFVPEWAEAPAS